MKILGLVDTYFFGTQAEQEGYNQEEKLWLYIPIAVIFLLFIFMVLAIN